MKKKILIFSMAYYPQYVGGAEVAIKEITDRMSPDEVEFHLITNRYDSALASRERVGNVEVYRIGPTKASPSLRDLRRFPLYLNKGLYQFLAYRAACRLHRTHHFDGVWAMMAHTAGVPAALFKKKFPRVTYLLTLQEGDPPRAIERKMMVFGPLFTHAFRRADVVQSISNFLADWARRMGHYGAVEVIPNGVDVEMFTRALPPEEVMRAADAMGKKEGDTLLITTSRLVHKNAVDDVIRALVELPPTVRFGVVGDGPDRAALETLARSLGVASRVTFVGHVDRKDMSAYLKAADIFVRPSRSEGLGISFIEAMATGIPVIATQEGGIADFLFDEERNPGVLPTGFAVDANAPSQVASKVKVVLADRDATARVVKNAATMVRAKYDWDAIARAMQTRVFSRVRGPNPASIS